MKVQTKYAAVKLAVLLFCMASVAFCGVFLRENTVLYCVALAVQAALCVAFAAADGEDTPHLSRTLGVAAATSSALVWLYILYNETGLSERFTDLDALRASIQDSGYWGFAVFIGLTVFQVVVLPVPQALTVLLGVAIYGPTVSFILSVIGTMIGSLMSFALGKIFGRRLCNWMFGRENTERYARILGEKGRALFIIMLLFPAFPDDMLCMIAGITDMTYLYFTVVCLLTRPVMIGVTAYLGSGVIPFEGWGIPVWIALVCLTAVLFIAVAGIKKRIEARAGKRSATR